MNQQVVYQDISQIHPYENNPRNNEAAIEPVAQSIKRFGFRVPILIDGKGTIIAGHTRYEAAKRLGMDKVPCIRADDLTDEQIRAYRIADNKVAEASSWNDDVLRAEMDALKALDVDLTDTGFSEVELDGLLREVEDADFEEFFTEPVQQPPKAADAEQSAETQQSTQPESSQLAVPQQSGSKLIQCPHCGEWLRHEVVSGGYIPSREDCERVPPGIRSGEFLLHPALANRRDSKMENVPARQRGVYFYARHRSIFKASRLGWLPESVHRLYQPQRRAAFLRTGCGFHRRL